MKTLKEILAKPFREADTINKTVMLKYLQKYTGKFLEIGPGGNPILEHVTHIKKGDKHVLELPKVVDYCKVLGYHCFEQNAGMDKWAIADSSMDVVVSNQCLEHIPNTDFFIKEARRVLTTNGVFLISVPNQGAIVSIVLLLLTINPPMNYVSDEFYGLGNPLSNIHFKKRDVPGHSHLRLFSTRAMNDLLIAHKFKVLSNHGGSWGVPFLGKFLASIFPYYGLYTTVLAQKS